MAGVACMTIGPFGGAGAGDGGVTWDDGKQHKAIKAFEIQHGDIVGSIRIKYDSKWAEVHGDDSIHVHMVKTTENLDSDDFLVSITGTYEYLLNPFVRSLTLISNNGKKYGPYGKVRDGDYHFSTESTGSKIIGFFGSSVLSYLYNIGVYVVPHDVISIGPFGGTSHGTKFEDHDGEVYYTDIKKMVIRYSDHGLESIETTYEDKTGRAKRLDHLHGQAGGGEYKEIPFKSGEFLFAISGYYNEDDDSDKVIIKSLTLHSNTDLYGPFGKEELGLKHFTTSTTAASGKIIGFHGTSDKYINSIGAYFQPLLPINHT